MTGILAKALSAPRRCLIFYFVGAMGIFVQMAVLLALTHFAHLEYLLATGLGVEAAVLHNFIWHERWTWADRIGSHGSFLRRLLRFHIANGFLSLAGNLILMRLLVGRFGLNFTPANAISIALCSVLSFVAGDKIVFREVQAVDPSRNRYLRRPVTIPKYPLREKVRK
jgi:dolichol-phosphate mannosyltransferase